MIYLVLNYKYSQYRITRYTQDIVETNELYLEKIQQAQDILENKSTRAYKNKILKSEQNLKSPWETIVFLITEEDYQTYTQPITKVSPPTNVVVQNALDEQNLINTMSVYQKWVYLIFWRDIR